MKKHNVVNRRLGALERRKASTNPHPSDSKKHDKWEKNTAIEIASLEERLKRATV